MAEGGRPRDAWGWPTSRPESKSSVASPPHMALATRNKPDTLADNASREGRSVSLHSPGDSFNGRFASISELVVPNSASHDGGNGP